MFSDETRRIYKYRADLVRRNLMNCHSGCDVHPVGNMKASCQLVDEYCNDPSFQDEEQCRKVLEGVERKCLEFFQRKYSHLGRER